MISMLEKRCWRMLCIALFVFLAAPVMAYEHSASRPASAPDPTPQGVPVLRVGTGTGCTHSSIQAAINAASSSGSTEIRVNQGSYTQAVQILDKGIVLIGGYSNCTVTSPTGTSTILAPAGTRPLTISVGSAPRFVRVSNFNLAGGDPGGLDFGGGLLASASASQLQVDLINTFVEANKAGAGGGIAMRTFAAEARVNLLLHVGSQVNNNFAFADGGGIWCGGAGTNQLRLVSALIRGNDAGSTGGESARGGGIFADNCQMSWEGSPFGLPEAPSVRNNRSYGAGGGIFARNGSTVRLRSARTLDNDAVSSAPIRIADNQAIGPTGNLGAGAGGGIRLDGATLNAHGVWVEGNSATGNGGGVHADNGSQVRFDRDLTVPTATGIPVAVCHAPSDCSRISRNTATDTGGAIFLNNSGTQAIIEQTIVRDNSALAGAGASLFAQTGSTLTLISSLLYNGNAPNGIPNYVFWIGNSAFVNVFWSTIVDNIPGTAVFRFGGTNSVLTLRGSIIYEVGRTMGVVSVGNTPSVNSDCVVWHNDSLSQPPYNFTGGDVFHLVANPAFVDPSSRNYQLLPISPAVDFCDQSLSPGAAPEFDLLLQLRGLPLKDSPLHGPFDLGAFELLPDRIFGDRFAPTGP